MNREVLKKILVEKKITINDRILFRTIFEVLSTIFTDENGISTLSSNYKINDYQRVWFLVITPNSKKPVAIKKGYGNFLAADWNTIFQFNSTTTIEKKKQLVANYLRNKIEFVTFAKIEEKAKGVGYHFIGIFAFANFSDEACQTMVFKKIKDSYQFPVSS